MINIIWPIFIIISYLYSLFTGSIKNVNNSIFEYTDSAIKLSITFLGNICLWNGIMKIAQETSLINKLTKILKPIINYLFPDLKKDETIKEEISINMVSNILGLGNAATPYGIKALKHMQKKNIKKDTLSNSMLMFIVINTASIQLIPTTVIAIRNSLNSKNSTSIIFPVWIATIAAAIAGITVTKILLKFENRENR